MKIQKSYLKGIELPQNLNYWEKLKHQNLYSLERRLEGSDTKSYTLLVCVIEGLVYQTSIMKMERVALEENVTLNL